MRRAAQGSARGQISWAEFERKKREIAKNATGKRSVVARRAVRHAELLAGLPRCVRFKRQSTTAVLSASAQQFVEVTRSRRIAAGCRRLGDAEPQGGKVGDAASRKPHVDLDVARGWVHDAVGMVEQARGKLVESFDGQGCGIL